MAKKKSKKSASLYLDRPSKWFRDSVLEERREEDIYKASAIERKRLLRKANLQESIKILRRYADGFEASDGFDLREVARLKPSRLRKIERYATLVRQEVAEKHIDVLPRSPATKKAVERHTGQNYLPGRKRFVVFTAHPEKTRVTFKGKQKKSVEVLLKAKGVEIAERYFYLADYTDEPIYSFEQIIETTRKMLPHMPKGNYVLETSSHGSIGTFVPKSRLLYFLINDYQGYDVISPAGKDNRGLAETITGFKLTSTTLDGAVREYNERTTRRMQLEKWRREQRAKQTARIRRRLKWRR